MRSNAGLFGQSGKSQEWLPLGDYKLGNYIFLGHHLSGSTDFLNTDWRILAKRIFDPSSLLSPRFAVDSFKHFKFFVMCLALKDLTIYSRALECIYFAFISKNYF